MVIYIYKELLTARMLLEAFYIWNRHCPGSDYFLAPSSVEGSIAYCLLINSRASIRLCDDGVALFILHE